jgi:CTP synthase
MANRQKTKFIFITGGVVSSLGKGIASSSLGVLLKSRGLKVTIQKFDPYINVDPGTMSPFQHGEVFVTDDGSETDLDIGHYERFIDENMSNKNNTTSGMIYLSVINKERSGKYLGKTVQVVPHITEEIKKRIVNVAKDKDKIKYDVVISEIGGTVGDIEGLPFLEAIRQFRLEKGRTDTLSIHMTLIPYLSSTRELKTKPTQHSVMRLREIGIQPDILICRTENPMDKELKEKIGLFCSVPSSNVIEAINVDSIYEVPLIFEKQGLGDTVIKHLHIKCDAPNLEKWKELVKKIKGLKESVSIGVCGKYNLLIDAYKSIIESFIHAGVENDVYVDVKWIDAEKLESGDVSKYLKNLSGILVPGGFGERGIEGKLNAIRYARENKIPFLGICLGLQCAVIEFARNVCNLQGAHSTEFKKNAKHPVIDLMAEQRKIKEKGATMRLGAYPCILNTNSKSYEAYGKVVISERHRHRYEVNNAYREILEQHGILFSGLSPDEKLVEIIEIPDHPWFIGTQFHPELKSRAIRAHPLFREFVKSAKFYNERKKKLVEIEEKEKTIVE